jgi:hypothetical protein
LRFGQTNGTMSAIAIEAGGHNSTPVKKGEITDEKSSPWVCVADTHCGNSYWLRPYSNPTAHCHSLPDLHTLSNTHTGAADTYTSTNGYAHAN